MCVCVCMCVRVAITTTLHKTLTLPPFPPLPPNPHQASVLLHMLVPSHQDNCPLDEDANVRATGRGGRELQACRSRSCLTCTNQPAVCRVDPTNRVVTCKGDTSACRVEECDLCSRCVAYYGGNLTSFRFVSACISRDYPYTCGSTPAKCFRSDAVTGAKVGGANGLFDSGKLWCGCYGDNCTAELVFHYIVRNVSGVAVDTSAGPSVAPSTGHDCKLMVLVPFLP